MWDGKTELDPISMARNYAHNELEQAAVEANMTREQWEEAQAAKAAQQAAQEATGSLFSTFSLLHKLDDAYMDALRRGDEETAHKLVLEAAKAGGYVAESDYQGSKAFNGSAPGQNGFYETAEERYKAWKNGEFEDTISLEDFVRNGIDPTNLKWQISDEGAYIRAEDYTRESIDAIRAAKASRSNTITIYRAVPKSVKEKSARNGDWVTLSEAYARYHITLQDWDGARIIKQTVPMEHVWWDGNDINEWGYDDGKEYAYRNTANNRKSLATVTYDANRNIIPLSQRFNPRKSSVSFSLAYVSRSSSFSHVNVPANGVVKTAKKAREMLKPLQGRVFTNKNTGISAIIQARLSRQTIGKVGASQMSVSNLKPFGYSREQAQQIHHTAAVHIHELFENAEDAFLEEAYKEEGDRAGVYHFFNTIHIEEVGSFDVNVMAVKQKRKEQGNFLYALELTIENPQGYDSESGLRKQVSTIHASRVPERKLSSYRSFVEKEMRGIKEKSQEEGTFMKAPNGEPTNLTEKQWLTVRTQAFKNWFGDWENDPEHASKVVDENGEPKVVYHGTLESFTSFLEGGLSSRSGGAIWFTDSRKTAEVYGYGGNVMAVFIKALNPRVINAKGKTHREVKSGQRQGTGEIASGLHWSRKKYDSLMFLNIKDYVSFGGEDIPAATSIAVFEPAQIKSATDNRGTFDPASPDITFSMVSPQEAQRIAREFNALEKSEGIRISAPGVYVKDTKAAAAYAKERYNALKAEVEGGKPLLMPIAGEQKEIQLPGRGFNEVKHHAADRRNLACLCGLRDLCESAIYINSASDSKQEKEESYAVVAYHYFAAKGNFEGASAYNADNSDEAYVSIVIAERSNGEFFYDIDATNVEEIDNDKNTSEELPSNRVPNPATTAPGGARKGRIHLTKEFVNYINEINANFATHSLIDITQAARIMMKRREDDMEGEELIARWDNLLQLLETASRDRRDGAARLGALVALLESTRSVLPPEYARLGRLNALMKWAAVYAHLISTGEVKRDGLLKGAIFDKFAAAMQRTYEGSLQNGVSEQEAKEAMQDLGERRLEEALIKVARECRGRLDTFVKARARERIERMAERAYPKKQRGKKSPRGKMDAASYRAMSTMLAWMDAPAERVAERAQQIRAAIEQMESSDTDRQNNTTRDELEEELRIVQLYGDWAGMSAGQARIAADDFVQFVITHRHGWDEKIQMEKRRRELIRWKMNFRKTSNANTRSRVKREGGIVTTIGRAGKSLLLSAMSYSQLIFAGKKVFGETFTRDRLNDITQANAALRTARRERDDAFARSVMEATGLKKESDINKWLNLFSKVEKKTGIFKREVTRHTLEMTRDEAEAWCSMTAQQRTEKRRAIYSEAEASGLAPENIPTESDIARLKEELDAMEARESTARKVRINVIRYGEEIELEASRDAVANAILLLEQEDYQHLIEYEGFTPRDKNGKPINRDLDPDTPLDVEQTLKPLYDYIGKDGRAFAYNLRRYVGENGKHMQAVYEAQQGVPLAMKPLYWRGNFNINTIKEKDTLTENNAAPGNGYGFLIDRVRHYNRLEWTNTATMVFASTVEAQNNYTHTSNITREWRALLADTNFQKQLEVELGRPYMTILKEWLDIIDGTSKRSASMVYIGKIINFLGRGLSYVALAGNVFVLLKQSSAILNSLMGGEVPRSIIEKEGGINELTWRHIGLAEYIAAMARARAGLGAISLKELSESEWFQARTDSQHKSIARRLHLAENKKQHTYSNKLADKAMDMIEWTDRAANLIGMQALADAVYRDMDKLNREKNLGLSEDAIKKEALAAVGRALETSAQPNEASQKTLFAARGGIVTNVLFQFRSETMNKLGQLISRIMAGESAWSIRDYMTYGAANAAIAAMIAWVRYGDDDKKRKKETWEPYLRFVLNAATGDLSAIPIIGDEIKRATAAITGEPYWKGGIVQNYVDTVGIHRHIVRLSEGRKNRKKMDWHDYIVETNGLIRKAGILTSFLGNGSTLSELVLSAAAAGNIIRSGADIIHGTIGE